MAAGRLVLVFALYGFYQSYSTRSLAGPARASKSAIDQLETQWKPIEELQKRITNFEQDKKTLSEFNRGRLQAPRAFGLLSDRTPGDTWLDYLSLGQGQLILRGESKSALKYLAELSKVEGLTEVKFASPVSRDPGNDLERFNIELQLEMKELRKSFKTLAAEASERGAGSRCLRQGAASAQGRALAGAGGKVYQMVGGAGKVQAPPPGRGRR